MSGKAARVFRIDHELLQKYSLHHGECCRGHIIDTTTIVFLLSFAIALQDYPIAALHYESYASVPHSLFL